MEHRIALQAYVTHWRQQNGHLVADAVLIRPGVWCGSHGCILHSRDVIRQSTPSWNGVPVSLDHPVINGTPVSIWQSERIFNQHAIGHLENATFRRDALRGRIVVTSRDRSLRSRLPQMREVSIGAFTDDVPSSGTYGGREYVAIAQRYTPDHLALLPEDSRGACSWEAGCGIGALSRRDREMLINTAAEMISKFNLRKEDFFMSNQDYDTEVLAPTDYGRPDRTGMTAEKLATLQKRADQNGTLLPIELNKQIPEQHEENEQDILLPTGFNRRGR